MRVAKIFLIGFRAFKEAQEISIGSLTTIVGKNDAGKSSILHALDIFFHNTDPEERDFNHDREPDDPIIIQVSFTDLPSTVRLEEAIDTSLRGENLLDQDGYLTIRKSYYKKKPKKPSITCMSLDYDEMIFRNLCSLKESDLNERGKTLGLEFTESGRSITNKDKRNEIRQAAEKKNVPKSIGEIELQEAASRVLSYLPSYFLFKSDQPLSEEVTAFQKEFKGLLESAVNRIPEKTEIEGRIENEIDAEVMKIHRFLLQHTDEVASIKAKPSFKWKDLVSFSLDCRDKQDKDIAFAKRGSGLRRLLMVAYFQYLAHRVKNEDTSRASIYGIEEPETYLHPGAQRILLDSLKIISNSEQVLVSSHSPVFAGSSDVGNLTLITRNNGVSRAEQRDKLDLQKVAEELGVEPCDQIYGYRAIVFVEGCTDCDFLKIVAEKFKETDKLTHNFEEKQIGVLPGGGTNLKHLITRKAIRSLNKKFAVILDSDRKSRNDPMPSEKEKLRKEVDADGGICHILNKREIENYLHQDVILAQTGISVTDPDFDDIKCLCGKDVYGHIRYMTVDQILERDKYDDNGQEKHELLELCKAILDMV